MAMGGVVGETLPLGLGIALNPIAIVVGILLLATARSRTNCIAFIIGWVVGLTILLVLASLLVQQRAAADPEGTRTNVAVAKIVFGLILIVASVRELRHRPPPGEEAEPPPWMRLLDRVGVFQSLALGLFFSVVSPKNLVLVAAAASLIGQAGLDARGIVVSVTIFVIICTLGVLIPLLVHFFGGEKADAILETWREWLAVHVGAITAVVMILLGVSLIGTGIDGLI